MRGELPSLVFMGTPDFAVPSLQRLCACGAAVRLVVTQPDRPSGRGKRLTPPPVKLAAEALGLEVCQPERVRRSEVIERIRSCEAECAVVVAYGQILPQDLLDAFPLGAINVHASLLPAYRGAAPIQRAILSGESVTGVTIMLLDAGMDTGPILTRREVPIEPADAFGAVHDKLAAAGSELLLETLIEWKAGRVRPVAQGEAGVSLAPPIRKEEMRLEWEAPAQRVVNAIRAFDPWPGAFSILNGRRIKCFRGSTLAWKGEGRPGEIVGSTEDGLVVLAGDGRAVAVGELQLEGVRRLSAGEFLRGRPIAPGSVLE